MRDIICVGASAGGAQALRKHTIGAEGVDPTT
jgi:chemotaxis response regulator CheB